LPSYRVIAAIAADTLRDLVTLTFDLLTLVSGHTWRVTWSIHPPSLKIITHVPYHVTYAYGANFSHILEIPEPDLPIHCTAFMALRLR